MLGSVFQVARALRATLGGAAISRRRLRWLAGIAAATACGGQTDAVVDREALFEPGGGGAPGAGRGGGAGASVGGAQGGVASGGASVLGGAMFGGSGGASGGAEEVERPFQQEDCPEVQRLEGDRECDAMGDGSDCGEGFGCYPYVEYPESECGLEVFGSRCREAGVGQHGEPCDSTGCAAGHSCFITGDGVYCLKLCPPEGEDGCPPGTTCNPTDLGGVNACG